MTTITAQSFVANTTYALADGTNVTALSAKGRWVKVQFRDGTEKNVGFADLHEVAKQPIKKTRVNTSTPGSVCPMCGSEEVYHGENKDGLIVNEDTVWGCHACGWDNIGDRKNGVVNAKFLGNYKITKLDDGSTVKDNGDDTAQMLRGLDLHEMYVLASKKLGTTIQQLRDQYQHLNAGMQRMNLGNRIRKAMRLADQQHAEAA